MAADPWVIAPDPPRELQVEVTAACNLRCRMCLVRYQPPVDRVTGTMTLDDLRRLIDSVPEVSGVSWRRVRSAFRPSAGG